MYLDICRPPPPDDIGLDSQCECMTKQMLHLHWFKGLSHTSDTSSYHQWPATCQALYCADLRCNPWLFQNGGHEANFLDGYALANKTFTCSHHL